MRISPLCSHLLFPLLLVSPVFSQTPPAASNSGPPTTNVPQNNSGPASIRQQPRCQTFGGPDRTARYLAAAEEEAKSTPPGSCFSTYLANAAPLFSSSSPAEPLRATPANDQIVALARSALANAETAWGQDDVRLLPFLSALENQIIGRYDIDELDRVHERMSAISEKAYGPDSPRHAQILTGIANGYELDAGERGDLCRVSASADQCAAITKHVYQEAEPFSLRAVSIYENLAGRTGPEQVQAKKDLQSSLSFLANLQMFENRFADAEATEQKEAALVGDIYGPSSFQAALAWVSLGNLYEQQKDFSQSDAYYQLALSIAKQLSPAEDPGMRALSGVLIRLAELSFAEGKNDRGVPYLQQSLNALKNAAGSSADMPGIVQGLRSTAGGYVSRDLYGDAQPIYLLAISVEEKDATNSAMNRQYVLPRQLTGTPPHLPFSRYASLVSRSPERHSIDHPDSKPDAPEGPVE